MITIKNTQRTIKINASQIKKDAQALLNTLGYPDFDLGIWLTTNPTIRKYNRDFRHKDKATDILSFPFYPDLKPGEKISSMSDEEKNLGDLIISLEHVKADGKKMNIPFNDRMKRLLVHGICHLLAYDHMNDKDYKVMLKKEQALGKLIGVEIDE